MRRCITSANKLTHNSRLLWKREGGLGSSGEKLNEGVASGDALAEQWLNDGSSMSEELIRTQLETQEAQDKALKKGAGLINKLTKKGERLAQEEAFDPVDMKFFDRGDKGKARDYIDKRRRAEVGSQSTENDNQTDTDSEDMSATDSLAA